MANLLAPVLLMIHISYRAHIKGKDTPFEFNPDM